MKRNWISPDLLQKLKTAISITEIVGEHVVLRKSGANYVGLCPFHSERTPSFSVSETKQLYHCYGCKKGGDLINFVMEILGVSFQEAVEELAEKTRVALPDNWSRDSEGDPNSPANEGEKRERAQRAKLALAFKLNRFVAAFFHHSLRQFPKANEYLTARGVPYDLVDTFYVGAANDSWDSLATHLVQRKAPLELASELGLIRQSQKAFNQSSNSGYFDLLRNRLIFPILNLRGKVAGFGGRALGDESPKYLNSPESLLFQKSKLAFGLFQAQKHIREQDELILVEGYFDVMAMHALGYKNTVATCGTALSLDHLKIFKRLASKVIVLFDADQAGIEATERAMEIGLEYGWALSGALLPDGMDPDNLYYDNQLGRVRLDGKEQMASLIGGAKALLDTRIEAELKLGNRSPEDRVLALKKIGSWLGRFTDPVGREVRIQWIEKEMGVSRSLIQETMAPYSATNTKTPVAASTSSHSGHAMQNAAPAQRYPSQNSRPAGPGQLQILKVPPKKSTQKSLLTQLSATDKILLAGLFLESRYFEAFQKAQDNLPPQVKLSVLMEYLPAREWLDSLFEGIEALSPEGSLKLIRLNAEASLFELSDSVLKAFLTETFFAENSAAMGFDMKDYQRALTQRFKKIWARFSQQIKRAVAHAESQQDVERYTSLMKEYLDVQRKMKEFINFYDEA